MTLYELSKDYKDLMDAIERGDIPEEAIEDTIEAVKLPRDEKLDNTACYIKDLKAEAQALTDEIQALQARKAAKVNLAERLKKYMQDSMNVMNIRKFESARAKVSFRKSTAVNVYDATALLHDKDAKQYLKFSDPVPNKTAIKEALKAGKTVSGCALVTNESIQIK